MKDRYENKSEDLKAIELIANSDIVNLKELELFFKENLLPLRERYVFYFIGKQDFKNGAVRKKWNDEKGSYVAWNLKSDWWERYLQYYRPMKLKIYNELNPELPRPEYAEVSEVIAGEELHMLFLKKGYEYKTELDSFLDRMVKMDLSNPNEDWNTIKSRSHLQIWEELKDIDKEYDTYELKIIPKKNYVESEYCSACHESPCMCSDPF